ncbi:unnamed protein product [Phyllotreta striolata]|uniref:Lysophospholipid acyltransferase 7 n=1 Tax=Phyllotreta striolata TaxID=444603 RepID=A0A9N9TYH1_PHYSR|nr:unnamed protein product [Phyllotreta striolata]
MNLEDITYLSLLVFSIIFGLYYRKIDNVENRKILGALVGFTIALIVSGLHVFHLLITVVINACIIILTNKRKCHIRSFTFSFLYLLFFRSTAYFGIPYPPSHTNLVQMMLTLKLVGLAFEVNTHFESKKKKDEAIKTEEQHLEDETLHFDLSFADVFCYAFNYCGVLTGPYFRYRTFRDHLYKPYYKYDNYIPALIKKLYWLPILGSIHLISNYYWPLSYVHTDEYLNSSFWYRIWYIWPSFVIFKSRIFFGLVLTEIVCLVGGMGVYPAFSKPKSGHGPTQNFKQLKETTNPETLKSLDYNYDTVHSIDPYGTDSAPTMREAMRYWNMTVQYWLANYVYKRFPYKQFRVHATMFMSALWHGTYSGYYLCIATVPFTLLCEDVWVKLLLENNDFLSKTVSKGILLFLKTQMFSYQIMSMLLLDIHKIMRFYNSIYHSIAIAYVGLYFLGMFLLKIKNRRIRKDIK